MKKKWFLAGGILWIAGLAASIAGMNIPDQAGKLTAVIGNIVFLVGLGITGAAWMLQRRESERAAAAKKEEESS